MEKINAVVKFWARGDEHAAKIIDALPGRWQWVIDGDGEVTATTTVAVDADYSDEARYSALADEAEAQILAAIAATVGEAAEFRFAA